MKMRCELVCLKLILAVFGWSCCLGTANAIQMLAPSLTPLNLPHNYSWNRMTTMNVYSGQVVPFVAYQFNTFGAPAGSYTITMNTVGFAGTINVYQNFFDPTTPNANFYADGVVGNAPGTVTQTLSLPANSLFEVVFSAKNTGDNGTFSASISGPGNVSISTTTNTSIRVGPQDKTIASGNSVALHVYGIGPLPQTWQWYSGNSGDISHPIAGATNESYGTPVLINSTSYWVKVTGPVGSGSANSSTAHITVTGNPNANYSGTLSPGSCTLQNNELYCVQRFQIQTPGNYVFTITPGFNLTTYEGVFDSVHPLNNLWGVTNGYYAAGTYDLVISKASPGGAFSGAIGGGPAIVNLLAPLPPQFLSSPEDTTIMSGQTAALHVSTTCGSVVSLQWYRGNSGDTSHPLPGATGFNYFTAPLTNDTMYWVRLTSVGTTNDSAAGTVFVVNGPVGDSGALTDCDRKFNRPAAPGLLSGSNVYYKTFVFQVSKDGSYTFSINSPWVNTWAYVYQGVFIPDNSLVNLSALDHVAGPFTTVLLSGPNKYYLVIAGDAASTVGSYDLTVSGPALVTKSPAPVIVTQPTSTNVFRNEATTLTVTSPSIGVSYQWYVGSGCGNKFPISGANASSYTTPPVTDFTNYWVELTTPGGYLFSAPAIVGVKPKAVDDNVSVAEDTLLTITAPGVLSNDTKADSHSLTVVNVSQPAHGKVTSAPDGSFTYMPATNYFGPDSFTYEIADGPLLAGATVDITVTPVNDPPIPGPDFLQTTVNTPVSVTVATLLANDIDPDGDALICMGYDPQTTQGGLVTIYKGVFTYHPPLDFWGTDTFSYTVSDSWGYGMDGLVTVTIPNPELLRLHIEAIADGVHLKFLGLEGYSYMIQYADDLSGSWNDLAQLMAPAGGIVEMNDTPSPMPARRFYRVKGL